MAVHGSGIYLMHMSVRNSREGVAGLLQMFFQQVMMHTSTGLLLV